MLSTDINITETTYSCQFSYVFGFLSCEGSPDIKSWILDGEPSILYICHITLRDMRTVALVA